MGWNETEYRFMGVDLRGRGQRADEALRLMRALWGGERSFAGTIWSFENATFEPLPEQAPEIWVGGSSERGAQARPRVRGRLAPLSRLEPRARAPDEGALPGLARDPAHASGGVVAFLEAGAEGVVVTFPHGAAMQELIRRLR